MPAANSPIGLSMTQVKADLMMATYAINEAETAPAKLSKTIKGQAAYHLQQACEKMVKIQLYASGKPLNNARIYKHSLRELMLYAATIPVSLIVPTYIDKNKDIITRWEAQGRYDLHMVVRIDTLRKCFTEAEQWYKDLLSKGYR